MRLRIAHKLALAFFLFAACSCGILSYALYRSASAQVMNDIRQRLSDIVGIATQVIDAEAYARLTGPDQEDSEDFRNVKRALQEVRDASSDIVYIYTLRQSRDGRILFAVDAEEDPEDIIHLGTPYDDASDLLRQVFTGLNEPVVETSFYTDEWGTWLSGYAPFYYQDGSRAGILGVDISAATVTRYRQQFLTRALLIFGATLPLLLLAGYLLGRRIAAPVIAMKQGAERIGRGDLDVRLDVHSRDEIGVLASTMDQMAANLLGSRQDLTRMMEKYRSIFDQASEGIFQSTLEGRLVTANNAMAAILGYDSPRELTESIDDLAHRLYARPEDRDTVIRTLETKGAVHGMPTRFLRKDGSEVDVELSAHLHRDGDTVLLEGMLMDISERLEREQAEKERRAAEAASAAKSEFLANMSHEIRTPMNAVMGLTDLMLRSDLSDKQRLTLNKIKGASQTLLAVINDILDFSKIEAGRMELEVTDFSLYEVMANLTELFSQKANEKDLELMVSLAEGTPSALRGDPVRLGQVLINLVGNAIKFTKKGEIVVEVRPAREQPRDADEVMLEFAVVDTGVGIPGERLKTIFESFTQADASTTRQYGGTGLGLSISRRLTELMGGGITVSSAPGQGSRFTFTARFHRQPEDRQIRLNTPKDLRGLKVLVVDDNKTAREILSSAIDSFRMDAHTAGSGEEALEIIEKADPPFDLILLDWKMPGMNGIETARRIKQGLNLDKTPIVCMVSAYGREDLIGQTEKNLLDAFLHKPVNQSFLFDAIMELFGRSDAVVSPEALGNGLNHGAHGSADEPPLHLRGARALLVEDNAINREVAQEWLATAGMESESANNGHEALEALDRMARDQRLPDVVLMDIQMPEMDGLEATRRLRADDRFRDLPIIAMTAHALKGDRERCLEAGMNDYVTKPIDPRALFSALGDQVPHSDRNTDPRLKPALAAIKPRAEADGAANALPAELPGIDIEDGLYRANKNKALFRRLLSTFLKDYTAADREISGFLAAGSMDDAHRLAHTVKGVAGSIGALRLSAAAAVLEKQASDKVLETSGPAWEEFGAALTEVAAGLAQAGFRPPERKNLCADAGRTMTPKELLALLDELDQVLDDDLDRARDLACRVAAPISTLAEAGADMAAQLTEHVNDFEMDEARQILEAVRNTLTNEEGV